jgi:chromosome transmission fidelity protein 8
MPIVQVHPPSASRSGSSEQNPLPQLLQTPSGLALLEIQGTIHATLPQPEDDADSMDLDPVGNRTEVGKIFFPLYDSGTPDDTAWMKRVYLYIGKHQRLTGEVKKLTKAMAVLQRKEGDISDALEVAEVVKYKIVFSHRPEPVGDE